MSPGADIRSEREARAVLKLAADAPPSAWRAAFQREVKAAHPDHGGSDDRVRRVIEAYRFLKTNELQPAPQQARPQPRPHSARPQARPQPRPQARAARAEPPPRPETTRPDAKAAEPPPKHARQSDAESSPPKPGHVRISIVEAFRGCDKTVRPQAGKRFQVRLPPGLQSGDLVRFGPDGEHRLTVEVAPMPRAELKGADLWLQIAVSPEFMAEGGRMEVETPLGQRKFWVSRTSAARGLYRAPGEGLPERPGRPRGHLYLKFTLDESLRKSSAKSLLARFAAAWAAA